LVAYKKGYNDFKYNNTLYSNAEKIDGALYFRTIYEYSFGGLLKEIILKIWDNYILLIILTILIIAIIFKRKKIFDFLLTDDIKNNRKIYNLLVISVIIRFLIMPFFCHIDFLSGIWVPFKMYYDSFAYYATDPSASFHILNQIIHFPIMMFTKFLMPELYDLWITQPYDYNLSGWYNFSALKSAPTILFILKIPFLLADYLCLYILLRLFANVNIKIRALYFWLFNPVALYVVYMIGRFEFYSIFFILFGLMLLKNEKNKLGILCIGIAAAFRQYPILFAPFLLPLISKNIRQFVSNAIIAILPLIIFNVLHNLPAYFAGISASAPTAVVSNDEHSNMLFKYHIKDLFFFPFGYIIAWLFIVDCRKKISAENYFIAVLLFFLILYSSSNFEPQYFMWIIPFLCIAYSKKIFSFYELSCYFLLFFLIVMQWDKTFTTQLAMPMFADLFYFLPSPERIINQYYSVEIINRLATSFFIGFNIWFIYKIYVYLKEIEINDRINN